MNSIPEIKRVAVIGAGNQGPKIACRCVANGLSGSLFDILPEVLEKAMDQIKGWLENLAAGGELSPEEAGQALARVRPAATLAEAVAGADLVIETVPEKLSLKRRVFTELNDLVGPETLLATNSSSLPCSRLADLLTRPENLFNINFSNPQEPHDLLVEMMKGPRTARETILAGERFVRSLGMVPVVTLKEIMGFSFNRTWRAIKREVLHLADQGYTDPQDLDRAWMLEFGSPWGPFGLMDIIGLDTVRDIENQYFKDSGEERDRPPALLEGMIDQGRCGVKTGQGFYTYPDPDYKKPGWLKKEGPWADELLNRLKGTEED
jgi:3-hydroxybutyryl-CoA dehydrogenase